MAYNFSGVDESLDNDNGVSGIDTDAMTFAASFVLDTGADEAMFYTASSITSAQSAIAINAVAPVAAGDFAFTFSYRRATTTGRWNTTFDLDWDTPYRFAIAYDRSSVANDPVLALNGSIHTVGSGLTEIATPVGTAKSGVDSVRIAQNVGSTQDMNGEAAEVSFHSVEHGSDVLLAISNGYSPLHFLNGLEAYWPLVRGPQELIQGANFSLTGTPTIVAHPRIIYPSASIVGTPVAAAGGGVILTADIGDALADGNAATVAAGALLSAAMGDATADGSAATMVAGQMLVADVGDAVADGLIGTAIAGAVLVADIGDAAGDGQGATVKAGVLVTPDIGDAPADGLLPGIVIGNVVVADIGGSLADGQTATVQAVTIITPADRTFAVSGRESLIPVGPRTRVIKVGGRIRTFNAKDLN